MYRVKKIEYTLDDTKLNRNWLIILYFRVMEKELIRIINHVTISPLHNKLSIYLEKLVFGPLAKTIINHLQTKEMTLLDTF